MKVNGYLRLLVVFFFFVANGVIVANITDGNKYVSAVTGKQCYLKGHEPNTIKRVVYHSSIDDCERYIGNFKK